MNEKLRARYGKSEHGNFAVVDTIGVPHPYMITAKHVVHASDHFFGRLDEAAIEAAEKAGAKCGICKGKLKWSEHKHALLVSCKLPLKDGDKACPELHAYLLKCKPLCEEDGHVGFAFHDDRSPTEAK